MRGEENFKNSGGERLRKRYDAISTPKATEYGTRSETHNDKWRAQSNSVEIAVARCYLVIRLQKPRNGSQDEQF
jgi:hypothetical protein